MIYMKENIELDDQDKELLNQLLCRVAHNRTVCEVMREIWDISEVLDEDLKEEMQKRILIAYTMVKKMNRKLREYKHDWDDQFWEINRDYRADFRRSKRKLKD